MSKSRKDSNDLSSMVSILQDRVLALEGALRRFKQNENAARESERLFRSTFDAVPDLIAILGMDHEIVRVNRAMAERLGTTPADCIGMKCYTVVHGTDSPPSFCPHARVLKTGQEETVEVHEDNLKGDFLVTCSPLHDLDGTLIGSVHVARDITERRRAQQALERDDALLRSIREAQSLYIEGTDPKQVFSRLLDVLVSMTQSQYGFLDEVVNDDQGNSYKRSLALSNIAWDEGSRRLYEQLGGSNMEFRNLQNLAGAPALTRRLVIANDAPHDPRSGGLPEGHPPLNSFMGIPMYYGGELVGVAGVANRPGGYDKRLAEVLEPFVMTCASIISAMRNERKERMLAESRRASETRFQDIVHNVVDLIWEVDDRLAFTYCSEHVQEVLGFAVDEMIGRTLFDFISPEDRVVQKAAFEQVMARRGTFRDREVALLHKDGRRLVFQISGVPIVDENGAFLGYRGVNRDVTGAKWAQQEEQLTLELLGLLTSKTDLHDLMASITAFLSRWAGCEAVGIRLQQGDDYPYFETRGFPPEFVLLENSLCIRDPAGEALRDSNGALVLECMCGNIIQGRFDPSLPFFTKHGSFWTNCTTDLLATTTEEQRQARTRNRCNGEGYESVALIPLRAGRTPLGLLQLNDKRKGRFTLELIELLERQATRIVLAIAQRQAEENLRRNETALRAILNSATDTAVLVDSDYRFVACNETAAARVGMSPDAMVGREMLSLFPPEVASRRKAFLDQVRATRQPVRFVDERAGLVLDNSYHPVLDQNGDVSSIAIFARDITDQRKAEEALRLSEEKYRTVADFTYDWEYWVDPDGRFLYVSPSCERITGYRPEEFLNNPGLLQSIIHPDDWPAFIDHQGLPDVQTAGYTLDFRVVTRSGQERWIGHWCLLVFGADGQCLGRRASNRDITEQRLTLQDLRESQERYQETSQLLTTVLENTYMMAAYLDTQFNFIWVNKAYAATCGHEPAFFPGKNHFDLYPHAENQAIFQQVVDKGEPFLASAKPFEFPDQPERGVTYWDWSLFPVKTATGKVLGLVFTLADVTDRIRAQQSLRESEEKYRQLIETATEGVWAMDAERRTTFVNQRMAESLGLTIDDMVGRQVTDFMFPEDLPAHHDRMKERREGHEGRYEQRFRKSDGSVVWCLVSARALKDEQGRFAGSFGMFTDITDRKRAEEALRAEQNNLKAVFEAAPIGMALFDGGCRIVSANQELARILHRDVSEILRLRCGEVLGCVHDAEVLEGCGHSPSCSACGIMNAITGGLTEGTSTQGAETEITLIRHGTEVRQWLRFSVEPIELEGRGHIVLAVADVTDRKQAEESVRRSEERLRLATKATNDVIWDWDIVRDSQRWNEAGIPVFGWSDIVEHPQTAAWWTDRVHPEDHERVSQTFHAAVQDPSQNHWQDEYRFRKADGDYAIVFDRGYIMRDEQGRAVRMIGAMLDLTDRKRSEEQLRRTNERLHMAQLAAGAGAWDWDITTGHIEWTPEMFALFGLDPKAQPASFESWRAIVHPQDRDIASGRIEEAIRERKSLASEYRIVRPDGTERWISALGDTTYDDAGSPVRMVGFCIDITDRKRAEETLRESEKRFRSYFELPLIGIAITSPTKGWLEVNKALCAMLGYSQEELKRMTWAELTYPDDLEPDVAQFNRVLGGEIEAYEMDKRFIRKDDRVVWTRLAVRCVREQDGKVRYIIALLLDITDRKQAEEAIRESEERYRGLVQSSPDIVYTYSNKRGGLFYSPRVEAVLGYSAEHLLAHPFLWNESIQPEDHLRIRETIAASAMGAPFDVEYRIRDSAGNWRWFRDRSIRRRKMNGETITDGLATDITESKRARDELLAANTKLDALWSTAAMTDADMKSLCDHILSNIVRMTGSEYGFYGFINDDESVMTIHTWSGDAMKDCTMVDKPQHFPIGEAGIWAEAVRQRKPLILNDYTVPHAAKKGYPGGHVALTRLMVVPIFSKGRIVSVAAVANRATDYGPADVSQIVAFLNGVQSIMDRKRAEDALKASLAEKEVLLREVHHRVKNNLAAIVGLLELQHKAVNDPAATEVLTDLAGRIKSMSLVHERLYLAENLSRIDLEDYIRALVSHIRTSLGSKSDLHCDVRATGVEIGLDAAIPCGLIINELVTNALKYAFPGGKPCRGADRCEIEVSVSREGAVYTLIVADNGVGLSADFDWATAKTLGLRLVRMVGQHQLGGHIELDRSAGTRFTMTFGSERAR